MGLYSCTGPKEWIGVVVECNVGEGGSAHLESSFFSGLQISYPGKCSHCEEYKLPTSVQPLFILQRLVK